MVPSVHDNSVVSYEVDCENRTITIRTKIDDKTSIEFTNICFRGVEAYHFQNDAFGNIIFSVDEIPLEQFFNEYGVELTDLHRMVGSPSWSSDINLAPEKARELGIKSFTLSSSLGLCGWALAKEMSIVEVQKQI